MLLVLVSLAVSVSVVLLLGAAAFLEVAFLKPESAAPVRPRLLAGFDVFQQVSATARRMTQGLLAARRDAAAARRAAAAGRAVAADHACRPVGADFCSAPIGVTAPEALEIAAYLRSTQPAERIEEIRRLAVANLRGTATRSETAGARCPLACADGTCVAAPVLPVQCRVKCELFGHEIAAATPAAEAASRAAAQGAADGVAQALAVVAVEGRLYDLNDALATALALPSAAAIDAADEDVFMHCRRYSPAVPA